MFRAKGHFWVATRHTWLAEPSVADPVVWIERLGRWWAAVPSERWPTDRESFEDVRRYWPQTWKDRRQELAFIGWPAMDEAGISVNLDASLHGSPAAGVIKARIWFDDLFPTWGASA